MTVSAKTETTNVLLQPNFFGEYEFTLDCAATERGMPHTKNPELSFVRLAVRHGATATHAWVLIATSYAIRPQDLTGKRRFKATNSPEGLVLLSVELFRDGRWIDFVDATA